MPVRIQRKRTKGWKMPPNTVYVGRGGSCGNPFKASECREAGYIGADSEIAERCKEAFRAWLGPHWRNNWDGPVSAHARHVVLRQIPKLRGKNLACWCPLTDKDGKPYPCHADVLLELANKEP